MANFNVFNDNLQKYSLDFQNDEIYKLHMNGGGENHRVGTLYAQKNPFSKAKFVLIQDVPESGSMFSRGVGHVSKSIQEIWLKFLSLIGIASNTEDKINGLRDTTTTNLNDFRGLDSVNAFARDLLGIRDDVNVELQTIRANLATAERALETANNAIAHVRLQNEEKECQIAQLNQGAVAVAKVAAENLQLRAQVTEAQQQVANAQGVYANVIEVIRQNDELTQNLTNAHRLIGEQTQAIEGKDATIANLQSDKGKRIAAESLYSEADKANNDSLVAKTREILDQAVQDRLEEGLDDLFDY